MARELVLLLLILLVCGPLSSIGGLWKPRASSDASGSSLERSRWAQIWVPLFPAAFAATWLIGWAINEPDVADEIIHPLGMTVCAFFALVWIRAGVRAFRAIFRAKSTFAAETRGFLRPTIRISPALLAEIDHDAAQAAYLHEAAHARHGDPLRIWLGQIATDLQFPSLQARRRFGDWLAALEIARDEEARFCGAEGPDLAAAIIAAARIQPCTEGHGHVHATIVGPSEALKERVERLLAPLPQNVPKITDRRRRIARGLWVGALALGIALGMFWGEEFVQTLPGVVLIIG